jgi:uncharacterized protein YndB with AHSA1/START domain
MNNTQPLIVEAMYNASADTVWKAITEEDEMRKWYFDTMPHFKPEAGFTTEFNVEANGTNYLHHWVVKEVQPGRKISYTWTYPDFQGKSVVSWELIPEQNKTRVKLTHSGLESFPQEKPDFSRESFTGGWNFFLGKRLKEYLEQK